MTYTLNQPQPTDPDALQETSPHYPAPARGKSPHDQKQSAHRHPLKSQASSAALAAPHPEGTTYRILYQVFARSETIIIRLAATHENIYRRLGAMKHKP